MTAILATRDVEYTAAYIFCGLGGGKKGFARSTARLGHARASLRCVGGFDSDPAAIADFDRMGPGRGTVLDLFSRDQYRRFHGHEPSSTWREATPRDLRAGCGGEYPDIVFGSAPCKGFSGLLSEKSSKSIRYQALNELAVRGLWLGLEAWKDDPASFWLWENVPRIATRGRAVLDEMIRLLERYGYAVAETTHDCGELGELAQSRKRLLLVCRHREKVPPFLYEPRKRSLRPVCDVLGRLPLPGDVRAGGMHRLRSLQWKTWVRLAFVEAGSDWRSLRKLRVVDGHLADYRIAPEREWFRTAMGVTRWDEPAGTVTSEARPQNGKFSVADPRPTYTGEYQQLGVNRWTEPVGAVSGQSQPGGGAYSVADPRPAEWDERYGGLGVTPWSEPASTIIGVRAPGQGAFSVADPRIDGQRFNTTYRIVPWSASAPAVAGPGGPGGLAVADPRAASEWQGKGKYNVTPFEAPAGTVIGASATGNGAFAVADPRTGYPDAAHTNVLRVTKYDEPARCVTAADHVTGGALCVADPRSGIDKEKGDDYLSARHYGVVPWDGTAQAVTGSACHDNGKWSVADPRCAIGLPADKAKIVAVIRALDGTWHRPFTTLELAALQSLIDPDEFLEFHGTSDTAWRERIGNAVPAATAEAIGNVMLQTLMLAHAGETFVLSDTPVWVQPIVVAISVDPFREESVE